jgi:Flp pilus assembly protein TadB
MYSHKTQNDDRQQNNEQSQDTQRRQTTKQWTVARHRTMTDKENKLDFIVLLSVRVLYLLPVDCFVLSLSVLCLSAFLFFVVCLRSVSCDCSLLKTQNWERQNTAKYSHKIQNEDRQQNNEQSQDTQRRQTTKQWTVARHRTMAIVYCYVVCLRCVSCGCSLLCWLSSFCVLRLPIAVLFCLSSFCVLRLSTLFSLSVITMNSRKTQNGDRQHNSSNTHDERQRQNWTLIYVDNMFPWR